MSRKQNTRSRKPDTSERCIQRFTLSESQLTSPEELEAQLNTLDGAENFKVYLGDWKPDLRGDRIVPNKASSVLHSCATLSELRRWLEVWNSTGPLVIDAELPPLAPGKKQEPVDWRKQLVSIRKGYSDTELSLKFGTASNAVKLLANENDPVMIEKRIENLWRMHPEAAEKLSLLKPALVRKARSERQDITRAKVAAVKRDIALGIETVNPPASIEDICRLLDAKRIPLLKSWKTAGFETWHAIWESPAHRARVKRYISGVKPAAPEKA